jgi:hypothetical protein
VETVAYFSFFLRNSIRDIVAYAPTTEKTFLKDQKTLNKNLARACRHSMFTRQVSQKIDIFLNVLCKMTKIMSRATIILALKFVFFTQNTKNVIFFVKQHCENVEYRELYPKFFIRFFKHF